MFLKIVTSKNIQYLKLVESFRENGKTQQRLIVNLGRLDALKTSGQLSRLGQRFLALDDRKVPLIDDLEEVDRFCYGDMVYKKLWDKYQFSQLLTELGEGRRIHYDIANTIYLMVIDRLLSPRSKLALFRQQGKYINIEDVALPQIYRCLDILADAKSRIETHIFQRQRNLFNLKVDVVFYDVTTYHFESVRADGFREFGFSKAGKFNEVQVVMGLLLDMEGHPIGFDLFPGNTPDGKTLLETLSTLKERFFIRRLIFVADQGLMSKENLHHIKSAGYEYIISARIKNFSKSLKQHIFSSEGYVVLHKDEEGRPTVRYKVIADHRFDYRAEQGPSHELTDNLVIYWSEERAQRDRQERERQMRKAIAMIDAKKGGSNKKGYRRYIATKGTQEVIGLDEDRLAADALWDGYAGIQTSETTMNATSVIEVYHQLWRIETAFRVIKSTLQARPIYHWTMKRITGHFVVCFIAFVLERALENKLKLNQEAASPERIREALNSLEVSEIKLGERRYYLKSKNHPLASKILNILRIKHLRNVTAKEKFLPLAE